MVVRGEIWLAALDPTLGSEIRKTRPRVVVAPREMHDYLRTVIVAPMTTGSRRAPFRIPVNFRGKRGLILLDQLRTLDKARLARRLGAASSKTLAATLSGPRRRCLPTSAADFCVGLQSLELAVVPHDRTAVVVGGAYFSGLGSPRGLRRPMRAIVVDG